MFGREDKLGLSLSSLVKSVTETLITEEDLENVLASFKVAENEISNVHDGKNGESYEESEANEIRTFPPIEVQVQENKNNQDDNVVGTYVVDSDEILENLEKKKQLNREVSTERIPRKSY